MAMLTPAGRGLPAAPGARDAVRLGVTASCWRRRPPGHRSAPGADRAGTPGVELNSSGTPSPWRWSVPRPATRARSPGYCWPRRPGATVTSPCATCPASLGRSPPPWSWWTRDPSCRAAPPHPPHPPHPPPRSTPPTRRTRHGGGRALTDSDLVAAGRPTLEVLATPGHTPAPRSASCSGTPCWPGTRSWAGGRQRRRTPMTRWLTTRPAASPAVVRAQPDHLACHPG